MSDENGKKCEIELLTACRDCGVNGQLLFYDLGGLEASNSEEDVSDE